MRFRLFVLLLLVCAVAAQGQEPPPPADAPPGLLSDAAAGAYERRDAFPSVNVYLPEMQASIRLRKLIRNVLFESQIDYEFINGDISTFLRYKYYARNFTYRIGVFDEIEFDPLELPDGDENEKEFERVRGALLLIGVPKDVNNRYFFLAQNDRLTFGQIENVDNRKNNIYTKVGYQFGTQFDERLNSIVGETRGRITPVLTAFREIGPQRTGFAAALTQSLRVGPGDYRYTKIQAEGLRRWDVSSTTFIFSRLHAGAFAGYEEIEGRDELPDVERYTIPRYEMFNIGGREALRGVDGKGSSRGTHEIHSTNEYFVPIFRNRNYKTGPAEWNTLYGIGYLGAGTVGFGWDALTQTSDFVVDAGVGAEASVTVRDFEVILSVLYANTVHAPEALKGQNVKFSIRTVR